ncbi:hypothetical protein IMZ31_23805 (plasmid) [Pontibacillus sp. ALD_SL1]|uniref:hypothetical protein n=1 Tax=Pontibacillus sp. ALD_SL1 TaxID=2777185 RepID=UPI001A9598D7|nr:hypothetical protein [Pontibacillus sp. ALD_SL1]QST02478.1 hypothetical protein IMZ31_23805 [Pontibacillus sp. ALD_SL1]
MMYTWDRIVAETKNAGGRIYSLPHGNYENKTFLLKSVRLEDLGGKGFFTLRECEELDLDEDYYVIKRLMRAYQNGANIPPVILDSNYDVIDGSHRLGAMFELGTTFFGAYVMRGE